MTSLLEPRVFWLWASTRNPLLSCRIGVCLLAGSSTCTSGPTSSASGMLFWSRPAANVSAPSPTWSCSLSPRIWSTTRMCTTLASIDVVPKTSMLTSTHTATIRSHRPSPGPWMCRWTPRWTRASRRNILYLLLRCRWKKASTWKHRWPRLCHQLS